ncbi:wsv068 [White spot syndrome virus]|uniref:Wsv068 n=4 Tax=White spot syndrome virus TaxID=342409 RepID=Q8VBA7_WSSVS|nr:wsv068 [Shrimp white spot syndrome virus]AAL33072.1 wsv068 [Shrimp white spot syndrome virus]AFX59445.1 wsv068 [White spot syndrome virus]AWQ63193.1 wsv068 [Shrimp white spot syndrome virus]AWQ63645.1 wsv068 [Shrimp white spot syndrome virus]
MCIFFLANSLASVLPLMNHKSSSTTPLQKIFLVVRTGIVSSRRENLIWGPKMDRVPVPVLSSFFTPLSRISLTRFKY